jgi:hypothetical protein
MAEPGAQLYFALLHARMVVGEIIYLTVKKHPFGHIGRKIFILSALDKIAHEISHQDSWMVIGKKRMGQKIHFTG